MKVEETHKAKPGSKSMQGSDQIDNNNNCHLACVKLLCTETIWGYLFWSIFQGLGPMVWFYPLNELDITGFEIVVLVWLTPLLVAIPGVLHLIQGKWLQSVLQLITLASVASFQAPSTLTRLLVLSLGNGSAMLVLTAKLWSKNLNNRYWSFWGLFLGLQAFICSRIWFSSFIPTWWDTKTNSIILAIGTAVTLHWIFFTKANNGSYKEQSSEKGFSPSWLSTGLGFGSLLYLTHWCFGEVSLVTRWVVKGYPDIGPQPNLWGIAVLIAISVGMLLSWSPVAQSKGWWFLGTCALCSLYYLPTWQGFTGGLFLAIYTFSIWPEMVDRLTSCSPARTMFVAMITYMVEIFFSVWTVAYNFVPGGVFTREHTDYLIGFICFCIFLGLFSSKRDAGSCKYTACDISFLQKASRLIKFATILLTVIGLTGFLLRYNPTRPRRLKKAEPNEFSAAIWTFHFGYDNKGWPSMERSAAFLKNTGADFITLLESDASKPFLGNNDLAMWLGDKLNMYVDFGPATKDHTWGNLILSKFPIIKSIHHLLPSPEGELAPGITATLNISGNLVDFVVTHMGNARDSRDRKLQTKYLAHELKNSDNPAVFLGYMTNYPHTANYNTLIKDGGMKDIHSGDVDRWCEYIMYKKLIRLGYARISHGGLSDTELQMAKFRIPPDLSNYTDYDRVITDPLQVTSKQKFTKKFGSFHYGHGYSPQHMYHMSTPKYFLP